MQTTSVTSSVLTRTGWAVKLRSSSTTGTGTGVALVVELGFGCEVTDVLGSGGLLLFNTEVASDGREAAGPGFGLGAGPGCDTF